MEPLQKEKFLEKYEYLENLLKYYHYPIDRNNMNMTEYLVLIHRIIEAHSGTSVRQIVEQIEQVFFILIENSVKIDNSTILFKVLVYFIQNGFELFIKTLKSEKSTKEKEFNEQLFNILDTEKIAKSLNLNAASIEEELNISAFKDVIKKIKPIFVHKIFSFPLFFFNKNIHENDENIKTKINKYVKKRYIKKFYETYNELLSGKKYDTLKKILNSKSIEVKKEIINSESNEEKSEIKNEIKDNLIEIDEEKEKENEDKDDTKQNSNNSSNKEEDKIEKSDDSNKDEKSIINDNFNNENINISTKEKKAYTSEEIMEKINLLTKKFEEENKKIKEENKALAKKFEEENKKIKEENKALAKKFEEENKALAKKFEEENKALAKNFEEEKKILNNKIKLLNDKLDLSILINNLGTQRDSYKSSLDILLKQLNDEFELNINLKDEDEIWKQTKYICDKILNSNKLEKSYLEKIVNSLISLLFCKDYSNCLIHGKGKFSEEIKTYYEKTQDVPIISIASYENMKIVTNSFFGSKVKENKEFKIINELLFSKIKKWNENDLDYSKYILEDGLNCDNIINDFNNAVKLIEYYNLNKKVDDSLEK